MYYLVRADQSPSTAPQLRRVAFPPLSFVVLYPSYSWPHHAIAALVCSATAASVMTRTCRAPAAWSAAAAARAVPPVVRTSSTRTTSRGTGWSDRKSPLGAPRRCRAVSAVWSCICRTRRNAGRATEPASSRGTSAPRIRRRAAVEGIQVRGQPEAMPMCGVISAHSSAPSHVAGAERPGVLTDRIASATTPSYANGARARTPGASSTAAPSASRRPAAAHRHARHSPLPDRPQAAQRCGSSRSTTAVPMEASLGPDGTVGQRAMLPAVDALGIQRPRRVD